MRRIIRALALLMVLPLTAVAGKSAELHRQVEASMALSGDITIGPDGSVREIDIDKAEKIEADLLAFLKQNIQQWKFEPVLVDGTPVSAKNRMYLKLIARNREDGGSAVRIDGASFRPLVLTESGKKEEKTYSAQRFKTMRPPNYPAAALATGAQGTVYLILKLRPDGSVEDAFAEKINLGFVSSEPDMEMARRMFARAAIAAALKWEVPTTGLDPDSMAVRVPVDFCLNDCGGYGKWRVYFPGPPQRAPWRKQEDAVGFSPDALPADGGIYPVGELGGLKLLTPLGG